MTKSSKIVSFLLAVVMLIGMIPLTILSASAKEDDPSKEFAALQKQYVQELKEFNQSHDSVHSNIVIRRAIFKIENAKYDEDKSFEANAEKILAFKVSALDTIATKDRLFTNCPYLHFWSTVAEWAYKQVKNIF